jgi:hypothetical protein
MKNLSFAIGLLIISTCASAQEGRLIRSELFSIPTSLFEAASGHSFKIAADSKENIALNACSRPVVYLYTLNGKIIDSINIPAKRCVRAMEFDENDNLLIMDNNEEAIYRFNPVNKKFETLPYQKPEDWYRLLNHFYKHFELQTIPTFYSNNDFLQDFYSTRFTYSYNLFLNYKTGFIYQTHYNFVKKINNKKTYINLKKENYWLSDHLTPKSKMLLINDEEKSAVYYDRFYNLIYENFSTGKVTVNPALSANSEPARFDYTSGVKQDKIYGISSFDKREITISRWEFAK